jgi:hypothetical protein
MWNTKDERRLTQTSQATLEDAMAVVYNMADGRSPTEMKDYRQGAWKQLYPDIVYFVRGKPVATIRYEE